MCVISCVLGCVLDAIVCSRCRAQTPAEIFGPFENVTITRITITGNKITKEYIIRRELKSHVGEPFHIETLHQDLQRLENLAIFSSIEAAPEADDSGVAIQIHVREMPWILPSVSVGYSEQDGWSVGPALATLNFLGYHIYIAANARFGGSTSYNLYLNYPWITWHHLSLDLTMSHMNRLDKVLDFKETSDEVTPWIGFYLGKNGRIKAGFSYFRMESDTDGITISPENADNLYRLGLSLGWDSRDSWRNPHQGWFNEIMAMKTGGILGGNGNSWLTIWDLRRFQPIRPTQTLVLGGLLSQQSGEVGTDVPSYLQYFMGGASSIRGYQTDVLGKELFGKNQLIGTIEYQYLLKDLREYRIIGLSFSLGLKIAAFVDTGIAWNRAGDFNMHRAKSGYGIGAHLLVPGVDVVRLDLGMSEYGDVVFHLAARTKLDAQRFRLR